jgi:hypothetical protein
MSSSVLLTVVLPDESQTHEEETGLLTNPQALWTVLIVNGPTGFALDAELPEHLSPTEHLSPSTYHLVLNIYEA